ncbi:unnamed protein product [Lepeophtheirus salmonis]|uniref:(salmon louse) hypothetical protein n=1 Tax=Lepeophtheirus salmonis TaxID=72036 RepID=A0A7R8CVT3_LEPSM|nr:unnamed protein product [Lepeophtheirus salmonis]CAF2914025.1 unnamed protein product [Lepeophtheirus salmonis]
MTNTKKKFEVYVKKVKSIWKVISSALFSHIGLFILCMLYAVLGAWIFMKIELPEEEKLHELKKNKSKNVDSAISYLKRIWWEYANNIDAYNYSRKGYEEAVRADLNTLKHFVVEYNSDYGFDGTDDWDYSWTFANSLLFTITIMSTIGYGHISPKTFTGRFFCIFYSLIGIGLLLVFMANIGDLMANAFKYLYSRCCCRWCRVRRKQSENSSDQGKKNKCPL